MYASRSVDLLFLAFAAWMIAMGVVRVGVLAGASRQKLAAEYAFPRHQAAAQPASARLVATLLAGTP